LVIYSAYLMLYLYKNIMSQLKWIVKKYVPKFLHPLLLKCYSLLFHESILKRVIFQHKQLIKSLTGNNTIQIIQPSFYSLDGAKYLNGGAERYCTDLAQIIAGLSFKTVIIQHATKFFHRKHQNIDVLGLPVGMCYTLFNKIIHSEIFGTPALRIYSPFTLAAPIKSNNAIGISHGVFWDNPQYSKAQKQNIVDTFLKLDTLVSVDTITLMYCYIEKPLAYNPSKIHYIPNYVDLKKFTPRNSAIANKNNNLVITYPRRLYAPRGYFLVESIISEILQKYSDIEFHFVGQVEPEAHKNVTRILKKYPDQVYVYEQQDDKMHEIYQKSDIILIPTVASEGTSLSCLEAMATGNAIIATNIGGLTNLIINDYNGLMIFPEKKSLLEAMEKLITSPELRARLGANAQKTAQVFSKDKWDDQWTKLLKQKLSLKQ